MTSVPALVLRAPLLVTQAMRVRATVPRLPEAACTTGTVGTGPAAQLVVVGDSVAAGVGVDHHEATVAGQLARRLSETYDRTVRWRVRARSGDTAADVVADLDTTSVADADVVVVSIGVNDVKNLHSANRWRSDLTALLTLLSDAAEAPVLLMALPPIDALPALPAELGGFLAARGRAFDAIAREVCDRIPDVTYVVCEAQFTGEMFAADGFHPSARAHRALADTCADKLDAMDLRWRHDDRAGHQGLDLGDRETVQRVRIRSSARPA
ncbi:SGNH/GDSL hydrolase family protein [Gordonia neofelifaecis]|uniref:GDSL family lipase n=1 Tax=Gordonia neofelifaecis NRRL B-59395 TaxID=644548 RepID=F1YFL7_9ACTN|nr:SGNH/GDSL hydrolase family protein [Gordonia neofelifaecis]EGD56401.1 GDSL family lipase [Gordonia neofelifaecis NRRL B-59395]